MIPKLLYELQEAYIERENFLSGKEIKLYITRMDFILKAQENRIFSKINSYSSRLLKLSVESEFSSSEH